MEGFGGGVCKAAVEHEAFDNLPLGAPVPASIVEDEDSAFAPKKNGTLRILCYCTYLTQPLNIVVSGKSSTKRMPQLSFAGKGEAGAADKNNERKEIDHLKKRSIQLVTGTNCNRTVVSHGD